MMKKPINHTMIRMDEVIGVLNKLRRGIPIGEGSNPELEIIDRAERMIRSLETRRRLVLIDGGKE